MSLETRHPCAQRRSKARVLVPALLAALIHLIQLHAAGAGAAKPQPRLKTEAAGSRAEHSLSPEALRVQVNLHYATTMLVGLAQHNLSLTTRGFVAFGDNHINDPTHSICAVTGPGRCGFNPMYMSLGSFPPARLPAER